MHLQITTPLALFIEGATDPNLAMLHPDHAPTSCRVNPSVLCVQTYNKIYTILFVCICISPLVCSR